MSSHPKLEYFQSERSELEKQIDIVQAEIRATIDVTIKNQHKNRLDLLFTQIEQIDQEIESLKGSLEQQKIHRLIEILQSGNSQLQTDTLRGAYLKVLRHRAWKTKYNPTVLDEIVTHLLQIPKGQFDHEALEEFVAYLVRNLQEVDLITDLQSWGEQQLGRRWAILLQQIDQQQIQEVQQAQPALLVALNRGDEASTQSQSDTYYQIKAWLIHNTQNYQVDQRGISPIIIAGMTGDETYVQSNLPYELPKLISQFLTESSHLFDSEPELHICLPTELMNHDVDLWQLDDDGPVKPLLGRRYKVVLRCTERWSRSYRQEKMWKQKWDRHKSLLEEIACDAFIEGDDDDLEALYYDLLGETVVGLKVKQAPTCVGVNSLFGVLLQAGTPIAIWGRSNLQSITNNTELARILSLCQLKNLLHTVKEERQKARGAEVDAHIGHHLSLLWDDPYLVPPKSA
jgi:ankyrin repeat protein